MSQSRGEKPTPKTPEEIQAALTKLSLIGLAKDTHPQEVATLHHWVEAIMWASGRPISDRIDKFLES
jgi:hypothetical protein